VCAIDQFQKWASLSMVPRPTLKAIANELHRGAFHCQSLARPTRGRPMRWLESSRGASQKVFHQQTTPMPPQALRRWLRVQVNFEMQVWLVPLNVFRSVILVVFAKQIEISQRAIQPAYTAQAKLPATTIRHQPKSANVWFPSHFTSHFTLMAALIVAVTSPTIIGSGPPNVAMN